MKVSAYILVAGSALLAACSTASTIERASQSKSHFDGAVYGGERTVVSEDTSGSEKYRVFHQGATGLVSVETVRASAEKRASTFCGRQNRGLKVLMEHTSKPPHVLGNFPRVELVFACVDSVSRTASERFEDAQYIRLRNLKKLLDDGAISREEYEREKLEILVE
jgi:hypothetical protein